MRSTAVTAMVLSSTTLLSLALQVSPLRAQAIPADVVGQRIRVELSRLGRDVEGWVPSQALRGVAEAVSRDSVTFRPHPSSGPVTVALTGIERVEVSRGVSRSRTALKNGRGAAAGAFLITAMDERRRSDRWVAVGLGFAVGALAGAIFPQEHWREVFAR